MQFRLRTLFILVAITALVLWIGRSLFEAYQAPWDSYATWDGANLIIDHLRDHNGEWPKDWNDINLALQKRGQTRGGQSIDELKRRLTIDFNAEPAKLVTEIAQGDQPPFNVIRLRNGKQTHWAGAEPNGLIYDYLTNPEEYLNSGNYW